MPGALDSCVNNIYEDGNIPASSGTPPTRVLIRPPFAAAISEAAAADTVLDCFLGLFMVEAASAADVVDAGLAFEVAINESTTALDAFDAAFAVGISADVVEAATADAAQDGTLSAAAAATYDGLATNVVLSNGNRTVLHNNTTTNSGAISTAFESTGKYYFEVTLQTNITSGNHLGIMGSGWISVFSTSQITSFATAINLGASGPITSNGGLSGKSLGAQAIGDVYSVAIDLTAHLGWFRKNGGNWNGDAAANPATGTGGVTIATSSFAPFVRFAGGASTTDQMTGNFGQSSFIYTPPSGFGNWPA